MPSPEDRALKEDDLSPHMRRAQLAGLMDALRAMPGGLDVRVVQEADATEPILHATNPAMVGRRERVVCRAVDMGGEAGSPPIRLWFLWAEGTTIGPVTEASDVAKAVHRALTQKALM